MAPGAGEAADVDQGLDAGLGEKARSSSIGRVEWPTVKTGGIRLL